MIQLYVKEMMLSRGMKPQVVTLQQHGIPFNTARQVLEGRAKNIKLDTLFKICAALWCTPNDILNYDNSKGAVADNHPINDITKGELENPMHLYRHVSPKELKEMKEKIKK